VVVVGGLKRLEDTSRSARIINQTLFASSPGQLHERPLIDACYGWHKNSQRPGERRAQEGRSSRLFLAVLFRHRLPARGLRGLQITFSPRDSHPLRGCKSPLHLLHWSLFLSLPLTHTYPLATLPCNSYTHTCSSHPSSRRCCCYRHRSVTSSM